MYRLLIPLLLLSLPACQSDTPPPPVAEEIPPPSPLVLEPYTYADSTALTDYGPYYTYRLDGLRATGGDPTLRQLINDTLARHLLYRLLPADSSVTEALPAYLAGEFADYRAQEVDPEFLQEAPHAYAREVDQRMEVRFQSDSLLVLALRYYEYTGGAHGNYATSLFNFTTFPPRCIGPGVLFKSGSDARLGALLNARAKAGEPLLYVDSVPVTGNFALLPDSLEFLYDPYAIGPYAAGEIALRLPYDSLADLLRPEVLPLIHSLR